jgi:hypothetical protein
VLVRTIEDVGIHIPDYGEAYLLGNPGFGYTEIMEPAWPAYTTPKAQRDYDAVEFPVAYDNRYGTRWEHRNGPAGCAFGHDPSSIESP